MNKVLNWKFDFNKLLLLVDTTKVQLRLTESSNTHKFKFSEL